MKANFLFYTSLMNQYDAGMEEVAVENPGYVFELVPVKRQQFLKARQSLTIYSLIDLFSALVGNPSFSIAPILITADVRYRMKGKVQQVQKSSSDRLHRYASDKAKLNICKNSALLGGHDLCHSYGRYSTTLCYANYQRQKIKNVSP